MCRTEPRVFCPVPANLAAAAAAAATADMPSHQHQLTRSMKPRLPRKLAASARINLNKYWHALEELMPVSRKVFDESDCNAINENLDNERRLAAMQLADLLEEQRPGSPETRDGMYQPPEEIPSMTSSCQDPPSAFSSNTTPFSSLTNDSSSFSNESSCFPQSTYGASIKKETAKPSTIPVMAPLLTYSRDENQPPNSNGCISFLR